MNIAKMNTIKSLNLSIIDNCNLNCNMCEIGNNKNIHILSIKNLKKILSSKYINKTTNITITGGEPLLHKEITQIFYTINALGFTVNTLSTNGILLEKLDKLLKFCKNNNIIYPNIHISIDGNEKIHDLIRGKKGSFKKSINTILYLKKVFSNIYIKLKYTISRQNISTIEYVYKLASKLKIDVSYKIIENDKNYTNKNSDIKLLNNKEKIIIHEKLKKIFISPNNYIKNLLYYLQNEKLQFLCTTPIDNLFIMPNGDIFPCTQYNKIGNINEINIDKIIFNKEHKSLIKYVEKIKCSKCFSLHGSYNSIK